MSVDVVEFRVFWFQILNEGVFAFFVNLTIFDSLSAIKAFGIMRHIVLPLA